MSTLAALETYIQTQLNALAAQTAFYAQHLATGREVAIRADESVNTLSIIKVPIMVLAYRDADAGLLDLAERVLMGADELRRGSGVLQSFAPGLQPTYRDLITQMIITSDNTATDLLIARLGMARINALMVELGYRETRLQATTGQLFRRLWELLDPNYATLTDREVFDRGFPTDAEAGARSFAFEGTPAEWLGRTTAREIVRLLAQIERSEVATPAACAEMGDSLRKQLYNSRLPQRIAFRAAIGHKTGDWPPIAGNDAGIIYSNAGPIGVALFATQNRGSFFELEATHGRVAEALLDAWGG